MGRGLGAGPLFCEPNNVVTGSANGVCCLVCRDMNLSVKEYFIRHCAVHASQGVWRGELARLYQPLSTTVFANLGTVEHAEHDDLVGSLVQFIDDDVR
jgi:hypothetical protein